MTNAELDQRAADGDMSAHDSLGNFYYEQREYAKAADHYIKAHVGGYYKQHESEAGSRLRSMWLNNQVPPNTDVYRLIKHFEEEQASSDAKTGKAASYAGFTAFFVVMALSYLATSEGSFLRSISLLTSGAASFFAFMFVKSAFDG